MATGLVIQTQRDAPAGLLDGWAARRGVALELFRADTADAWPDPRDYALIVALGSSTSAVGDSPEWVRREIEWLRAAEGLTPILGICFGAQVLAAALGGRVSRLPKPEVGWVRVASNDPDRIPEGPWMAWHEDGFTLPPLAYELARNEFGVQAFCHGRHLGVQFHPEVTPEIVRDWASSDHEDMRRAGVTAADLAPEPHARRAARDAEILFDGFAARAGLAAVASRA